MISSQQNLTQQQLSSTPQQQPVPALPSPAQQAQPAVNPTAPPAVATSVPSAQQQPSPDNKSPDQYSPASGTVESKPLPDLMRGSPPHGKPGSDPDGDFDDDEPPTSANGFAPNTMFESGPAVATSAQPPPQWRDPDSHLPPMKLGQANGPAPGEQLLVQQASGAGTQPTAPGVPNPNPQRQHRRRGTKASDEDSGSQDSRYPPVSDQAFDENDDPGFAGSPDQSFDRATYGGNAIDEARRAVAAAERAEKEAHAAKLLAEKALAHAEGRSGPPAAASPSSSGPASMNGQAGEQINVQLAHGAGGGNLQRDDRDEMPGGSTEEQDVKPPPGSGAFPHHKRRSNDDRPVASQTGEQVNLQVGHGTGGGGKKAAKPIDDGEGPDVDGMQNQEGGVDGDSTVEPQMQEQHKGGAWNDGEGDDF